MDQPRALTLMVTAGQWQAVKDTLSRPNGRSLTTPDTFGNSTTSTVYSLRLTIDTAISYVQLILSIQQPTKLSFSNQYSNLRHYVPIDTATRHITIPLLIQRPIKLLYSYYYSNTLRNYTPIVTATHYFLHS